MLASTWAVKLTTKICKGIDYLHIASTLLPHTRLLNHQLRVSRSQEAKVRFVGLAKASLLPLGPLVRFCRATLCMARPMPSCGVRLPVTFVYCIEQVNIFSNFFARISKMAAFWTTADLELDDSHVIKLTIFKVQGDGRPPSWKSFLTIIQQPILVRNFTEIGHSLLSYGQKTIFNMAAVRHLKFSKFGVCMFISIHHWIMVATDNKNLTSLCHVNSIAMTYCFRMQNFTEMGESTRSSAVKERPRDDSRHWLFR